MADTEPERLDHQDMARIDGPVLAHFHMRIDDLVEEVFMGIDDYIHRHPEITNEIAQESLGRRACDMAEGYRTWVEEGE